MTHYCTYFDRGFLAQGLALWASLRQHSPGATLWVLALDDETAAELAGAGDPNLRVVPLAALEAGDADLLAVKAARSRVEYFFTLSPCWPRWLLAQPGAPAILVYLDADLFFFSDPEPVWASIPLAASVGFCAHRFPPALREYEKWGRFNVGVQFFRNDERARAVLDDWRGRCLDWCHDRVEADRFADQKYLDAWPGRFGAAVHVLPQKGVNLAPWNWSQYRFATTGGALRVDGELLVVFHFAKFRPVTERIWDSGQLEFDIMPRRLRQLVYGPYWRALESARTGPLLRGRFPLRRAALRSERSGWKAWLLRVAFGPLWLRLGDGWWALGLGPLGRNSGTWLARWRRRGGRG